MKGRKGSTDEGGVRSPLLIRWPGRIPAGRVIAHPAAAIDLAPTLADLTRTPWSPKRPLDGLSLAPLLTGTAGDAEDWEGAGRTLFSHWNGRIAARRNGFLLDHQGALFHLESDPGQQRNIASLHPETARSLAGEVRAWRDSWPSDYPDSNRPFTAGAPGSRVTRLPARDATLQGGLERSNRFPNDSFIRHWRSAEDALVWDVDVLEAGTFEAEIRYACPARDVGARLALEHGPWRLEGRVDRAWDPPLLGMDHDLVDRQESYVKAFGTLSLGRITLPRGRGPMTLRATDIPGRQALEFRSLILRRIH